MPKAPSPQRAEARSMYLASGGKEKLLIIAEKIGVPAETVRSWKNRDKWDAELSATLQKKSASKKRNVAKKRGAPKGNKNALGHEGKAPTGAENGNYKHGAYADVYWDFLDDEERIFVEADMASEEEMLEEQIRLLSIRERRIMLAIKKYRDAKDGISGLSLASVMVTEVKKEFAKTFEGEDEQERYEVLRREKQAKEIARYFGHDRDVITTTTANIDIIKGLEATLTQVQTRKTRCIKSLADLRIQREKLELVKLKMGVGDDEQLKRAIELLRGVDSAF